MLVSICRVIIFIAPSPYVGNSRWLPLLDRIRSLLLRTAILAITSLVHPTKLT